MQDNSISGMANGIVTILFRLLDCNFSAMDNVLLNICKVIDYPLKKCDLITSIAFIVITWNHPIK